MKSPQKKSSKSSSKKPEPEIRDIYSPRVAAIQMSCGPDRAENLAQARSLLDDALKVNPNVVAFPENLSVFTADDDERDGMIETLNGTTVETFREWAAEGDIWLLAGSIPTKAPGGKIYNTSLFFSPEGEIHARYDKIHLFDVVVAGDQAYRESKHFAPGKKVVVSETPWGNFGLSICYDLRFPELYREQSARGAHTLFIPSAFTAKTGKAHWDVLTRARAIENQCYVVAPGQVGEVYPGRECHGHTRIVDPWGRIIAERAAGPGVVWADLDYLAQEKIRTDLPVLEHRRL